MRIGFDLDGVIADYDSLLKSVVGPEHLYEGEHITTITNKKASDYVKDTLYNRYRTNPQLGKWLTMGVLLSEDEIEMLKLLAITDTVFFISARPTYLYNQTRMFLKRILGIEPNLILGVRHKGLICNSLNIAYFIDDRYAMALEIANTSPALSYLLCKTPQSINKHYRDNVKIVNSIFMFIKNIIGQQKGAKMQCNKFDEKLWIEILTDNGVPSHITNMCLTKMMNGCKKYGEWEPETDSRNYLDEIKSELQDCINYSVMAIINDPTNRKLVTDLMPTLYQLFTVLETQGK